MLENTNESVEIIWDKCLQYIKDNVDETAFATWFEPIIPQELKEETLYIIVPTQFFIEWIEANYISILRSALHKVIGQNVRLIYKITTKESNGNSQAKPQQLPSMLKESIKTQELDVPIQQKNPELKNPFVIPGIRNVKIESQLNSKYNFDYFLEGESNRLARSAGMAVAKNPGGTAFNPLLIYGGVGLGKTHLAHAIGIDIKEKHPEKIVLYISTELFVQQYQDAVRRNNRNDFIYFYQLIDVLIVDDIQFLSGKSGTQEVFFHIFNHLHQNGKQIILTSDKPPVEIQFIEQRLLSRFKWGLSAEILPPDYSTRVDIIKNILYRDSIEMPDTVVEYVAKNVKSNIREIEGAIISLVAQSSFNHKEITLDLAQDTIGKFVKNTKVEVSIDVILKVISDFYNLSIDNLCSKTRTRNIVQARQMAMYFAKQYTNLSLANIGSQIGKKDHATVLHALKTVENLLETDKEFKKQYETLDKNFS
ncbi:chromosomal replication initiator protein DnaA [Capnocytophaga sp. ARDL2]|uniref:chromosomal replication initiator protein DnaA n=1 Tax=Capnocytophaga sp. ARDL2 TaxID=3238809 RepID=UPI003556EB91